MAMCIEARRGEVWLFLQEHKPILHFFSPFATHRFNQLGCQKNWHPRSCDSMPLKLSCDPDGINDSQDTIIVLTQGRQGQESFNSHRCPHWRFYPVTPSGGEQKRGLIQLSQTQTVLVGPWSFDLIRRYGYVQLISSGGKVHAPDPSDDDAQNFYKENLFSIRGSLDYIHLVLELGLPKPEIQYSVFVDPDPSK
jgi:hypothetical protein